MNLRTALIIGLRHLKTRTEKGNRLQFRMLGSIVGIALSLIPLVVVIEVSNGLIEGITARYLEVGTYHFQVRCVEDQSVSELEELEKELYTLDNVKNVHIERQGMGLISSQAGRYAITIRAVPPDIYQSDNGFKDYFTIISGDFNLSQPNTVLVGRYVADELKIKVDDTVKILTYRGNLGERVIPRVEDFTVTGIFSVGYQDLDKSWVYIPFEKGKRILAFQNARQFFGLKVIDPYIDLPEQTINIRNRVFEMDGLGSVSNWNAINRNQYSAFEITKILLILIMGLIVIVAIVNISSSMVMIVMEKTLEIGILKSIGIAPATVTLSFLITGLFTGFLGTILGIIFGLLLAVNINEVFNIIESLLNIGIQFIGNLTSPFMKMDTGNYIKIFDPAFYLEKIPIRIYFIEVLTTAFLAIFLSVFAAYFPSRMAAKIKPLEVIRRH